MDNREWQVSLYKDLGGEVLVGLYELDSTGQMAYVDSERFGPFDTATDVCSWLIRHWAPRARFPLR